MDPLIEHPPLLILLDLVLLKPRVYLHLLFNRGHPPNDGRPDRPEPVSQQEDTPLGIWNDWSRLFLLNVVAESASRVVTRPTTPTVSGSGIFVIVITVLAELVAQHLVTTLMALATLRLRGWWKTEKTGGISDGRQKHFK